MLYYRLGRALFYLFKFVNKIKNRIIKSKTPVQVKRLAPALIPKYRNQLGMLPVFHPMAIREKTKGIKRKGRKKSPYYIIDISRFRQQLLPEGMPKTTVWGYGGLVRNPATGRVSYLRSTPGATIEAVRNIPIHVKWINRLRGRHLFAVDPTLHWANPNKLPMEPPKPWPPYPPGFKKAQRPVPTVTHLHGGEVPSEYDGHPEAWFTYNGRKGPAYRTACYTYYNTQEPATLWYHDHALGITRLNVYAGLAGLYVIRNIKNSNQPDNADNSLFLPEGKYELPLIIQDRSFNEDGSLYFESAGDNPDVHPYWKPEFFGDTIMVNGMVWPELKVERRQYRFRILNGSNARFYNLKLSNKMSFIQIGSDGGLLPAPVNLTELLLAPAERAEVLIDFSDIAPDTAIILNNDANAPYPGGTAPDPDTVGQIMRFAVLNTEPVKPEKLPVNLNNIPSLKPDSRPRTLVLYEVAGTNGPEMLLLNGQKWSAPVSVLPRAGATEEWRIVNLTMDTHPVHLHLVQFLVKNRQNIKVDLYRRCFEKVNGIPPFEHPVQPLPLETFLIGKPAEPDSNEKGWKDTVRMNPGQVTRITVRFAPQDIPAWAAKPGENLYPFDASKGPGYVWHCHILDHEDNEMMRPYKVLNECENVRKKQE